MSTLNDIADLVSGDPIHIGYAPTGAQVPYSVARPIIMDQTEVSIAGDGLNWDSQYGIYCCGASVEACYNLGLDVMRQLNGARVGGTTLAVSMGYSGAPVEGHYETQVTVQLNQGGI